MDIDRDGRLSEEDLTTFFERQQYFDKDNNSEISRGTHNHQPNKDYVRELQKKQELYPK